MSDDKPCCERKSVLMAPQIPAGHHVPEEEVVEQMINVRNWVVGRGHNFHYICSRNLPPKISAASRVAHSVESQEPGTIKWIDLVPGDSPYFMLWPKDGLQDWGEFLAAADSPSMLSLARGITTKPARVLPTCEGGLFVRSASGTLVSSAAINNYLDYLPLDAKYHQIPHPYSSDLYRRRRPSNVDRTHIDLDCVIVSDKDNQAWCLVGEVYHNAYRVALDIAADSLNLNMVVIPQDEVDCRCLNMVVVSNNALIIPSGCNVTSAFLADILSPKSLLEVNIDERFNYNGGIGGLGCMTTVIEGAFED